MKTQMISGIVLSEDYNRIVNDLILAWETQVMMRKICITPQDRRDIINLHDGCFFE